jgi:hypothetical protein
MGKAVKSVGNALGFGGGGSPGPRLDFSRIDSRKDVDERTKPSREASLKLLTDLQAQAAGQGPSLATEQLKSATSRNLAQTLAAASAQRGGSPALAQRELLRAKGDADRQVAEQGALARMQEQQAARDQLANLSIQQQAQDLAQIIQPTQILAGGEQNRFAADVAKQNAIRQQQTAILGNILQGGSAAASAAVASDENNKVPLDGKSSKAKLFEAIGSVGKNIEKSAKTTGTGIAEFDQKLAQFAAPEDDSLDGSGDAVGQMFAQLMKTKAPSSTPTQTKSMSGSGNRLYMSNDMCMSDERQKTVKKVNPKKDMKSFLDAVEARSYVYKDPSMPGAAPGKRYGVMAQDLEKSEVGKTLVKDTPNGKMVDTVQGFGAVLAAQAELNERLKRLESTKKKKA